MTRFWRWCFVVGFSALLVMGLFWYGVPTPEVLGPDVASQIWRGFGRVFGWRSVAHYPEGCVSAVGYMRGPLASAVLVRGKTFDPGGRQRSKLISGTGVLAYFCENGAVESYRSYLDGHEAGTWVFFSSSGTVERVAVFDDEGEILSVRTFNTEQTGPLDHTAETGASQDMGDNDKP